MRRLFKQAMPRILDAVDGPIGFRIDPVVADDPVHRRVRPTNDSDMPGGGVRDAVTEVRLPVVDTIIDQQTQTIAVEPVTVLIEDIAA